VSRRNLRFDEFANRIGLSQRAAVALPHSVLSFRMMRPQYQINSHRTFWPMLRCSGLMSSRTTVGQDLPVWRRRAHGRSTPESWRTCATPRTGNVCQRTNPLPRESAARKVVVGEGSRPNWD